ncbi:MAG: low molecular weight phosphotyrosine protein phosphatase, partial [Kofleriaceae bacterium]
MRICFVCLGNICRSPTAEVVMQRMIDEAGLAARVTLDSAGTGNWHAGEAADSRSRAAARA